MIIADENVEQYWIRLFESRNYPVYSIRENHPGLSDKAIIELVAEKKGILLTEDKDFGELVFSHLFQDVSVILMRYDEPEYSVIEEKVLKAVELFHETTKPVFITITKNKTRVRYL